MANRVSQWFRKLSGHHAHHHHRKMTREDFQKLPRHVAIIMDGNGRWAKQHRLNVAMGHRQGTETLREIIRHTDDLKIEALSIYAFSTENWKRSKEEVGALMQLILDFFASEIDELDEKNVRILILGDKAALPEKQRDTLIEAERRTAKNTGLHLNIALNYGGRAELTRAARLMAQEAAQGRLNPEEISEEEAASDLAPRIAHLAKTLTDACDERAARLLQSGLRVALCGQPNVGKSSLLNALLGEEKAIVTAIPGTTRDLVEGTLMLSGSVIHLTDTAGLHDTDDPVERIGVDRARRALADADVVLLVLDMSRPLSAEDESLLRTLHGRNGCIVLNKSDLPPVLTESDLQDAADGKPILTVSASVPDSLQPLKSYLASQPAVSDQPTLTQPRHIAAARRAVAALHQAEETLRSYSVDLAGVDLQQAQMALAEITGDEVEEKLLDEVFGRFCVGK